MKVVYYYRGRTGSAGFLLPEDMALLKRLFAHGSLPPKAQLRGKRCWLYLRVNTNNPAADEIGISGQAALRLSVTSEALAEVTLS